MCVDPNPVNSVRGFAPLCFSAVGTRQVSLMPHTTLVGSLSPNSTIDAPDQTLSETRVGDPGLRPSPLGPRGSPTSPRTLCGRVRSGPVRVVEFVTYRASCGQDKLDDCTVAARSRRRTIIFTGNLNESELAADWCAAVGVQRRRVPAD